MKVVSFKAILLSLFCITHLHSNELSAEMILVNLSQAEFQQKVSNAEDVVVIDVRSPREYAQGRIPNAINIPHGEILGDLSVLDVYKNKDLIFYCRSGVRALRVTNHLADNNFELTRPLYQLDGDMLEWNANNLPIEK